MRSDFIGDLEPSVETIDGDDIVLLKGIVSGVIESHRSGLKRDGGVFESVFLMFSRIRRCHISYGVDGHLTL